MTDKARDKAAPGTSSAMAATDHSDSDSQALQPGAYELANPDRTRV